MKYIYMIILLVTIMSFTVKAQEKFQISGKISGVTDDMLFLVRTDGERPDTLATTLLKNGVFMFTGELACPVGGYITTADGTFNVPLIVESTNIMINVTPSGALIQGGKQQQLFVAYNRITQRYVADVENILAEAQLKKIDTDVVQKRVNNAYQVSVERTMNLLKTNPDAYATAYIIALGIQNETEESLQAKYNLLGENARNSIPGQRIARTLEHFASLAVGQIAPNFTVERPNGDALVLYDVPAKIKLVVFWASWDIASRQANPSLIKIYQQFRPKNFEIISVSLDNNRVDWERAIRQDGLVWTNGCDFCGRNAGVASLYLVGNITLPYTVLIDYENKIVAKGLIGKDLEDTIRQLSKKNKNIDKY